MKQLSNWVMSGSWKTVECVLERVYIVEGLLKAILVGAQKKQGGASVFLESTQVVMSRMLLEIWTVKAVLMRSWMEMGACCCKKRKSYWTGRKSCSCFNALMGKKQTNQQNLAALCLRPGVLWKVGLGSGAMTYLAEAIFMQSAEGVAWLLLNAYH